MTGGFVISKGSPMEAVENQSMSKIISVGWHWVKEGRCKGEGFRVWEE